MSETFRELLGMVIAVWLLFGLSIPPMFWMIGKYFGLGLAAAQKELNQVKETDDGDA